MLKKAFFLFCFMSVSVFLSGGPIEGLIEKSGSSGDYPDADVLIIFDSTLVDVQESGLSYVNTHQLFKILTPKGALKHRVITYGYDPLSAYVEIKKVVVYRKNGSIEELDMSKVLDYPAPARMIYWGASEKMIEVGRLEPGDAVEVFLFKKGFTYALLLDNGGEDEKYIPPMRGHFYDIIPFWSDEPLLEKVYITSIPKDKTVQYEFYNGEVQSSALLKGEKMVYSFTKSRIMPLKPEPNMVSWTDEAPELLISTSPDWFAKSVWFHGVNEDFGSFESTPEIDNKVSEILNGAVDFNDSISRLTHWVADEIRYSGISMGPGEGYTLHTGEMNFTDRCGVCKDKAGMLITMLRAAGLESYPAMTMAGSRIDDIPADQFNHCVTVVKNPKGEYQLLDPTWVPFIRELWSSAEQQQNYLMGIPGGSDLAITPVSAPQNHYVQMIGFAELSEKGNLTGSITIEAEGQSDASIRRFFVRNEKSNWYNAIENQLLEISPSLVIKKIEFDDPYNYLSGPIKINIDYEIPGYALVTPETIIFDPVVTKGIFKTAMGHLYINTSVEERKYGFRDRCSRLVTLTETIIVPEGFIPVTSAWSESYGNNIASYDGSIRFTDNTLLLKEKITLSKRVYDPADWPMFKKVVNDQKDFAKRKNVLEKR